MSAGGMTAKGAFLIACSTCHLLCRRKRGGNGLTMRCPRCGAPLHSRKPHSVSRTWALIIAGAIFYIPANVFPITQVTSLVKTQSDTILSGVIYFVKTGMWPIALVIFVASIFVPLLKLIILAYLLVSVQRRSTWRTKDRARLYRVIETIGRWSMVDIFVVTILVAVVHLGNIASIKAGPAVGFFAAVVVITMLAAMSFDPRLIWEGEDPKEYE